MAKLPTDAESLRAGLTAYFADMFRAETGADGVPVVANTKRFIDFLVMAVPPAAAVIATVTTVVNLWLAGRVVKFSGRLVRPWPDIQAMSFPPVAAAALGAAIALTLTGGLLAILASIVAASLIMAYAVLGFAVLHAITHGQSSRPFLLGGVYTSVVVFGWPVLMLALLGLIETFVGLRARAIARMRPPRV
jgi:hypothetical protein